MLPVELLLNHGGALASGALSLSKKQPYSQKLLMVVPVTFIVFVLFQESNGPSDAYAAISNADRLQAEPESLRKWREEQRERLEVLGNTEHQSFCFGTEQFLIFLIVSSSAVSLSNS